MYTILRDASSNLGYVRDGQGSYKEYVCDTEDDITTLPTGITVVGRNRPRPGSTAIVIATRNVYILNNTRKWVILAGEV